MALLAGTVAEMATGEGKTLTAAIAAYGHVRRGNGPVHVLTVNDYLARRDAEWMAPGLRPARPHRRLGDRGLRRRRSAREAYAKDVTYVSVSEAGFDYLRDQLVTDVDDRVQPTLTTAIVDEADSILIDEARVPMVLAGAVAERAGPGARGGGDRAGACATAGTTRSPTTAAASRSPTARPGHGRGALGGIDLYDDEHVDQLSAVNVALHAQALLHRDVDYIVRGGAVELVDEMRGRVAQRRRWPDGLQAAVEAKEGLDATAEGEVLGTITVQALRRAVPARCAA